MRLTVLALTLAACALRAEPPAPEPPSVTERIAHPEGAGPTTATAQESELPALGYVVTDEAGRNITGSSLCEQSLREALHAAQGARKANAPTDARPNALEAAQAAVTACDGVHAANAQVAQGLVVELRSARAIRP